MLREIEPLSDLVNARGIVPALPDLPCNTCHFRSSNFCGALFGRSGQPMAIRGNHRYCYFPFAEVRARIRNNPTLFDA